MITDTGLGMVVSLAVSGSAPYLAYMLAGSGTTPPQPTDTGLQYEIIRFPIFYAHIGSPLVGDTFSGVLNSVVSSGLIQRGVTSFSELGMAAQATGGQFFSRAKFSSVPLSMSSEYRFEWDIIEV